MAYGRLLYCLRDYLNRPGSYEQGLATIKRRLEEREQNFLRTVRRCVIGHPRSPYAVLLRWAGCEYGDLEADVRKRGVDAALRSLAEAKVVISLDEFKGRVPLVRPGLEHPLKPADFDNPVLSQATPIATGGSTGQPVSVNKSLDYLAARAAYDSLSFQFLDLYDVPLALWFPQPPASAGLDNALRYAKAGRPALRWFDMLTEGGRRPGLDGRLFMTAAAWISRGARNRIPCPEPLSLNDTPFVLRWLVRQRDSFGRVAVQLYVSQAVRLSRAARRRGIRLEGVLLKVGAEPITPAKAAEIKASGADVEWRYCCAELGTIAMGCLKPSEVGDMHLMHDMIAMLQFEDDGAPGERQFLFTSLLDVGPKIMINTSLGDCGLAEERDCGCPWGELGFRTHLRRVHSIQRVTCEGMTVSVADLLRISEEHLCSRYGGSALDYQWVEVEDASGFSRLRLRVSPSVGPLDEEAVVANVLSQLGRINPGVAVAAGIWRQAATVTVERRSPRTTSGGKTLPFLRERP
jgi:hypothetical protein